MYQNAYTRKRRSRQKPKKGGREERQLDAWTDGTSHRIVFDQLPDLQVAALRAILPEDAWLLLQAVGP